MLPRRSALLLLLIPVPPAAAAQSAAEDLLRPLLEARDAADPALVERVAALGTRAAAEGLIEAYDLMATPLMRREIVRALPRFDGLAQAQEPALEKLASIAASDPQAMLREEAVDALAACPALGKAFLARVVEAPAPDEVRERALHSHVAAAQPEDAAWYLELYERPAESVPLARKARPRRGADELPEVLHLDSLRRIAFDALADGLEPRALEKALEDPDATIREGALRTLAGKDLRRAARAAQGMFTDVVERPSIRAAAAEVMLRADADRAARDLVTEALKFKTPEILRRALADLLAAHPEVEAVERLARKLGRGKPYEQAFALLAARNVAGEEVGAAAREALSSSERELVVAGIDAVVARGDRQALGRLEELLLEGEDPALARSVLDALSTLRAGEPEWLARLEELARSEDERLRNAALAELARAGVAERRALFEAALEHERWSTRLVALEALAALQEPETVELFVRRMQVERGRLLHELAEALWGLTGMPFGAKPLAWKAWWEGAAAEYEPPPAAELAARAAERERRRLERTTTTASFFGIPIASERVVFVVDVSGSMIESVLSESSTARPVTRLEVARRELERSLGELEEGALFNVVVFAQGVARWVEDVAASGSRSRAEANEFVKRLTANGGTNLYGALRLAFADRDVDTIVILSDGEPSAGAITDPPGIREAVRRWNRDRGIKIHGVAIGGALQILEWLAEDSGGSHVKYR